jgi:transposase
MYLHVVPNRNSPPAILLRESYREGGKVKNRTIANVSKLPPKAIALLKRYLAGDTLVSADEVFEILPNSSPAHGHVEAVLTAMGRLSLPGLIAARRSRERDLVVAMIASRILKPSSKLDCTRWWAATTLAEELGVSGASEDELYQAMDWLLGRQARIEKKLAARHLKEDALALYDLSSSYFEGVTCPLASYGHARDGKKKLQVNYGLLTNREGIPVSISVFKGNTGDPTTLLPEAEKVRGAFKIERFVMVGDRGMITQKQIDAMRPLEGVDWIAALGTQTLRKLAEEEGLQLGLFDEQNLFEVRNHPDFEGERLVACRNPALAGRRASTRQSLLEATSEELSRVQEMVGRGRLRGQASIRARLDAAVGSALRPYVSFQVWDEGFETNIDEERLIAALTRTTRLELDRLQEQVEKGRLKGGEAIGERVREVLARRNVGRHIRVAVSENGFEIALDTQAICTEATAPLRRKLEQVRQRIERGALYGAAAIGLRVGKVINKYKVAKHFVLDIRDDGFDFHIDQERVAAEAALDGVYVIRTSLSEEQMDSAEVVRSYKALSEVERAFRTLKSIDLEVRPIRHRTEQRVRAHFFLCMLAYYVQRHMLEAWRPLLFADEDQKAKTSRDPVAPAERSKAARKKASTKRLADGTPVHSFRSLLHNLSGLVRNTCRRAGAPPDEATFYMLTPPDAKQQQAYDLLKQIQT